MEIKGILKRFIDNDMKILEDPNTKPEVRRYIKEKITSSKMLMRSLDHRESTIVRITEVIVKRQEAFLREGIDHMKPMTMQQVADEIGVHETTVSRAINQKYVQTPKGLFSFKYFFNSGYTSTKGEIVQLNTKPHCTSSFIERLFSSENIFSTWSEMLH